MQDESMYESLDRLYDDIGRESRIPHRDLRMRLEQGSDFDREGDLTLSEIPTQRGGQRRFFEEHTM